MIKKIDHLVITTEDIAKCLEFYSALGFRTQQAAGRWELFSGDFKINVHLKGKELEPKAMKIQPGSADLCFETDEPLDCVKQALKEKGICMELGIVTRHGVHGEMQSLYLRDPDGNLIEICHY